MKEAAVKVVAMDRRHERVAALMEKNASTAALLRRIAAAQKASRPVTWNMLDNLAKKTQSTAERQSLLFNRSMPNYQDKSVWGRTGRQYNELWGRAPEADNMVKEMRRVRADIARARQSWFSTRLSKETLDRLLTSQQTLREGGQDIGRMRGRIAPPSEPILPKFNLHDTVDTGFGTRPLTPGPKQYDFTQVYARAEPPSVPPVNTNNAAGTPTYLFNQASPPQNNLPTPSRKFGQ